MELKNRWGDVIFALEGAKTILELVLAARAAKKSLGGAYLSGAYLSGADLSGADLSGADLSGAYLSGRKIIALRAFSGSLYPYQVWAVACGDGSRWVRMGCHFKNLEEWESIGIRASNPDEFPDDGNEVSEERAGLFELAKAAALRITIPEPEPAEKVEAAAK